MDDKYLIDNMSEGHVKIADDVIAKIATVATGQIDGVIGNIKDLKSGVADMLGVKTIPKNAKVSVGESEAIIDMYITVEYGKNIVDICNEVQDKVKENVETMTGLEVVEVNVHVIGISTPHSETLKE